jgi:hypothetical protein
MIPNFIIIGAPRAGTTSLYYYLRQHPQIAMSRIKETNYFAFLASQIETEYKVCPFTDWPVRGLVEYKTLFDIKKNTLAVGEASPFYLFAPGVPQQIKTHLPDVKLILILRNPIQRAYSAYLKDRREGAESRLFEDAISEEIRNPSRVVCSQNYYVRAGMYFEHISRYMQYFDRAQLKIIFQEDFQRDPLLVLSDLFDYLCVDREFTPDVSVRFNEALPPLVIQNNSGRRFIKKLTSRIRVLLPQKVYFSLLNIKYSINKKMAVYPVLPRQAHLILREQYSQDILRLQHLLGRDFSNWLVVE